MIERIKEGDDCGMSDINFLTFFPDFDAVHIEKDVGVIGIYLNKCFKYML